MITAVIVTGAVLGYLAGVRACYEVLTRLNWPRAGIRVSIPWDGIYRDLSKGQDYAMSRCYRWWWSAFWPFLGAGAAVAGVIAGTVTLVSFRAPVTAPEAEIAAAARRKTLQAEIVRLETEAERLKPPGQPE